MNRRRTIMMVALAVLLALIALYCLGMLSEQRAAAVQAYQGLEQCRQLAELIEQNRQRPALAADQERLASEMTGLIEAAAKKAGISLTSSLSLITPMSASRIGDTPYKEKPTQVSLRKVTLQQVVALVHELVVGDSGLHARSIELRAPRREDGGDDWEVELVLTYLIYEPLQPAASGATSQ